MTGVAPQIGEIRRVPRLRDPVDENGYIRPMSGEETVITVTERWNGERWVRQPDVR